MAQSGGGLQDAVRLADEAMELSRGLGDDEGVGRVLWALSTSYYFHGDIEAGIALTQQALDIFEGVAMGS